MARELESRDWPDLIRPGARVFIGSGAAVPQALVASFLEAAHTFKDVEMVHIHTLGPSPWIDARWDGMLRSNSFFLTPGFREAVDAARADYTPASLSEVAAFFTRGVLALDVALVMVSPPDEDGKVSLGTSVDVTRSAVDAAPVVVAQINAQMPRTGGEARVPLDRFARVLPADQPLPELPVVVPDPRQVRMGAYAAQLIEDGSTLQVGLGPSARSVLSALAGHRHLGIHTGMIEDGLIELIRAGVVDNSRKGFHAGVTVCSHVLGTRSAYDFVHENREVEMHRSDWVNHPATIARNQRMVSINSARQIDLTGQVVRDSRGHHFHGGVGAQLDFIRGAAMSPHGRPLVVMPSCSRDGRRSRIVANLEPGTGIAAGRTDAHYVVTEYGVARLWGRSIRERVTELVQVAHPNFREDLLREARHWGWLPRFFSMPPTTLREGGDGTGTDSRRLELADQPFLLRPLHPSDMRRLQDFFYSHDPETVRQRYGYVRDSMTTESAYRLVAVDQNKDLALGIVEEAEEGEVIRAVGRYYLDEGAASAEIAFVVHEDNRRMGMGRVLLEELARLGQARGVATFWASVLAGNRAMLALFRRYGATAGPGDDVSSLRLEMSVEAILKAADRFRRERETAGPREAPPAAGLVRVGVVCDGVFEDHDPGPGHPESSERYRAVVDALDPLRSAAWLEVMPPRAASPEDLLLCHTAHYLDVVRMDVEGLADQLRTGDTAISEASARVAALAAGSCLSAADAVLEGRLRRALCAVRPPGHHASADRGMGFCIYNNAALVARHAQRRHGVGRILIVDWDVHHGNGTQDIFHEDGSVFFFSCHQWPLYPGTGREEDTGAGQGEGTTMNVHLRAGTGAGPAIRAVEERLVPAMEGFKPELVVISAGFDARADDPIGGLKWDDEGFATLTRLVVGISQVHAQGRVVSVLEGGYNPQGLARAVEAHLRALAEDS